MIKQLGTRMIPWALCAFTAPSAWAQQVQIYGILDAAAGAVNQGRGWTRQLMSGGQSGSRLGFTGSEDLGGGLRATFRLESQINLDDGSTGLGVFWGRRAHVGLSGSFGEVLLGRDYSPGFYSVQQNDIGSLGMFGTLQSVHSLDIETARFNNGIFYTSPDFSGLQLRAMYSFGERADPPLDGGNSAGLGAYYKAGPLHFNVYYHDIKVATPGQASSTTRRQYGGGGGWNFGDWRLTAALGQSDPPGDHDKVTYLSSGVGVRTGLGEVMAQAMRLKSEVTQGHATTLGLSYIHLLSKRTNVYASVGRTRNDSRGSFPLNNSQTSFAPSSAGLAVSGAMIGMRHTF